MFFFFQAEDGIRDAQESRGLGDVYKRQTEGGIEKWLNKNETPDGRVGAILQFWGNIDEQRPFEKSVQLLEKELSYRIRQDVLAVSYTHLRAHETPEHL